MLSSCCASQNVWTTIVTAAKMHEQPFSFTARSPGPSLADRCPRYRRATQGPEDVARSAPKTSKRRFGRRPVGDSTVGGDAGDDRRLAVRADRPRLRNPAAATVA